MASQDSGDGGGVAWYAHIGGFIAGMILIFAFKHSAIRPFGGRPLPSGVRLRGRHDGRRED